MHVSGNAANTPCISFLCFHSTAEAAAVAPPNVDAAQLSYRLLVLQRFYLPELNESFALVKFIYLSANRVMK